MNYSISFTIAAVSCFVVLRVFHPVAVRYSFVDQPNERKTHKGEVPLIGGIGMFLGFVIAYLIFEHDIKQSFGFIMVSTLLLAVGVLDDRHDISVRLRFFLQTIAVLLMTSSANVMVSNLGDLVFTGDLQLANWAIPFTVIAAIGSMNATNMIDGIDGLAGSTSLICFLAVLVMYAIAGEMAIKPLLFVAVLIPFIFSNLRKGKKVFMGDAGSMFLGLGVAWVLVEATQGENAVMNPVTALWLFAIPLIDMWAIMYRRARKGQSPFKADRDHLHHIFLRAGYSDRGTLNTMSFAAMVFAAIGILGEVFHLPEWLMFAGFLWILSSYIWGIRHIWTILKHVRHRTQRRVA
jgi:UDP-GlcNAc:undecaprenyl-phosphate GlcNAc-1-phosphate transferase